MKTLIFNGSPRKNGNTATLVGELEKRLTGDVKVVSAYFCDIGPCIDCRYCEKHDGCAVKDGMQEVYADIQTCDNIVLASPVNFSELTGKLLSVLSRFQTYWSARYYRGIEPVAKKKRGGIILVCGGPGPVKRAEESAKVILREINAEFVCEVVSRNTNRRASIEDMEVTADIAAMAETLNAP